jgi:hypothetical protein
MVANKNAVILVLLRWPLSPISVMNDVRLCLTLDLKIADCRAQSPTVCQISD